ncbi:DNA internalization-related competence protein ComEC/Rec2 [Rhodanobacter sp. DHB23]|uniref:DNA internalization-related competence protein ComEC/Rec2 n=1 Tax=Rhodanobacter sp. DHB23 TaxID=2775923 RepID=UPI00177BA459|nr:DNA internalization-related competence protein ComEC/Rec2 [Rhodanobacter sp. DHB23]MBD8871871.1 DNA internalization-related competence protein ComEC/Rec2 [Rhodanobacter sp. DHB23]
MALAFDKPFTATLAAPVLLLGVLAVQWLPALPPRWLSMLSLLLVAAAFWCWPRWRLPLCGCAGVSWAMACGAGAMDARLPRDLEGRDFAVTGRIAELPLVREDATRFALYVDGATLDGKPVPLRGRTMVSWYDDAPPLAPCERWRLSLRLKRPRGLLDPGASDGERTALQRRIVATGYVRGDAANARTGRAAWCVDGVRDAVSRGIAARVGDPHDAALLRAFSVGDTRGLSQQDWEVARANGIPHLIAISGFHVGVVAVIGAWLVGALYLLWPGLALRLPRAQAQAAAALLAAGAYGALAGFGLPTVRTLLMIAVVALARCSRRGGHGAHSLALAVIAILAFDPLSVLAAGFWLSFTGVALLMLCLQSRGRGLRAFLHELTAGQLLMTLSLLPLTLWFFGEASLVGALSNLVAVPFVSFVIVPCVLLGTVLLGLCPPLAAPVLGLAARLAHAQWWLLERMATWPGAHWYLPEVWPWALLLATLGALWLFMPRGLPLRALGLALFLPLLWPSLPKPAAGAFEAWVLDVGQGLSVLLRTRDHVLLYDTGARYPSGYDLGEAAVLPSIRALGIARLDVLMVSHADNDHAGGADAVVAAYPQAVRYAGEPARMHVPMRACAAGQAWVWDGVRFRVLSPAADAGGKDNDRSCVLLVEGTGNAFLLTGDISSKVEPAVAEALDDGPSPVLLVPHHGSKTSSGADFIDAVDPPFAIVSAGWRNRFGHPRPEVLARYAEAGVPVLNTADNGAIALDFPRDGPARVAARWRLRDPRYWRERP